MGKVTREEIAKVMAAMGKRGGNARAKKLSKAELVRIAASGGRAKGKAAARRKGK